jgi:hypothetical protein
MARGISIDVKKFDADAKALIGQLERLSKNITKDAQKIVKPAAEVVAREIAARTPVYRKRHYRYKDGRRVAEYYPGNLRRSIQDLELRRVQGAIVGPRVEGSSSGKFSGSRTDGYYFRFVDRGAPSIGIRPQRIRNRGARAARPRAYAIIQRRLKERLNQL